jgi:uncharacterized membrane protein
MITRYWLRHRRPMRSVVTVHPALIRDTLFLLLIVATMPFFAGLLGNDASTPTALALYSAANVLAIATLIALGCDIERLGLAKRNDPDERGDAYGHSWQTWLNLAVFVLCIPGAYLLGRHGRYLLLLLAIPNRITWLILWRGRHRFSAVPA